MDVSGEHQLDVLHSVYKVRLTEDGQPIQEEVHQYDLGSKEEEEGGKQEGNEAKEVVKKKEDKCGRYHAESMFHLTLFNSPCVSVVMVLKRSSCLAATRVTMFGRPTDSRAGPSTTPKASSSVWTKASRTS